MQKIFEELIVEASTGRVIIDDEEWPITFNTKILDEEKDYENEENFSTLIIKDEERFLKLLSRYLNDKIIKIIDENFEIFLDSDFMNIIYYSKNTDNIQAEFTRLTLFNQIMKLLLEK